MTKPVAEFLASKVFCILQDPGDDSLRVTANEFGAWSRDLPMLLGIAAHSPTTFSLSDGLRPAFASKGVEHSDSSTILYPEPEFDDALTLSGVSLDSDSTSGNTYTSSYQTPTKGGCW